MEALRLEKAGKREEEIVDTRQTLLVPSLRDRTRHGSVAKLSGITSEQRPRRMQRFYAFVKRGASSWWRMDLPASTQRPRNLRVSIQPRLNGRSSSASSTRLKRRRSVVGAWMMAASKSAPSSRRARRGSILSTSSSVRPSWRKIQRRHSLPKCPNRRRLQTNWCHPHRRTVCLKLSLT